MEAKSELASVSLTARTGFKSAKDVQDKKDNQSQDDTQEPLSEANGGSDGSSHEQGSCSGDAFDVFAAAVENDGAGS